MSRRRARSKRIRDGKARPHAERGQAALRREWSDWVSLAREYHAGLPPPTATPVLLSCAGLAVVSWYFSRLVLFAVAAGVGAVHMFSRFALGGYTRRLPVVVKGGFCADKPPGPLERVLVTGGCGFLGWAVTKHLADQMGNKIQIIVADLGPPHPSRRVANVQYVAIDLALDDLTGIIGSVDAVIHTAGLVDLTSDAARTYNAHVVATARLISAAQLCKRCRFIVGTSSVGAVTSPFVVDRPQLDLPADYIPPEMSGGRHPSGFPFFCSYSSTKFFAERILLAASKGGKLKTVAVRLPMIFGLQDPMVVAPLLKGQRGHVPDGKGALVQFVYVKNAALAHVHALLALLNEETKSTAGKRISGRVFNVTNGDTPRDAVETWNVLVSRANQSLGSDIPHMKPVPFAFMYMVACMIEAVFAVCCGHVPFRRHPVWNLTRAALCHSCTSATQSMKATVDELGFSPRFTTEEAFGDMIQDIKSEKEKKPGVANPLNRISWASAGPARNVFDRMSGPGMTVPEAGITLLAMVGGIYYAWLMRCPTWSNFQLGASLFFALINASAVVQCTTPTSKRWYHEGGRMPDHLAFVISLEVMTLTLSLHGIFSKQQDYLSGALSQRALCEALCVTGAVLLTHFSPLSIQRGVGVLCACAGIATLQALPCHVEGMEWAIQLLLIKYCVSHVPRHEPYT